MNYRFTLYAFFLILRVIIMFPLRAMCPFNWSIKIANSFHKRTVWFTYNVNDIYELQFPEPNSHKYQTYDHTSVLKTALGLNHKKKIRAL